MKFWNLKNTLFLVNFSCSSDGNLLVESKFRFDYIDKKYESWKEKGLKIKHLLNLIMIFKHKQKSDSISFKFKQYWIIEVSLCTMCFS